MTQLDVEAGVLSGIVPWADPAPAIGRAELMLRLERARMLLDAQGADALLVVAGPSLRYFAGIPWHPTERLVALLLPRTGRATIVCPAFELGSLEAVLQIDADIRLWQEDEDPHALALDGLPAGAGLALDPDASIRIANALSRAASGIRILDGSAIIGPCRLIKSPAELALLAQAMGMTLAVQRLAASILRPGIEAGAVRRFIDAAHRAIGAAEGSSFCAVQFGHATAFPHGVPGEQTLSENELVLVDTGCVVDGYHSDLTRTYAFGRPDDAQRRIWEIEQQAQQAAFEAAAPGVTCEAVDAAARRVLERNGLGPGYALPGLPHRTGHGIGLSIHEPAYLVRGDRTVLAPGMCFSDEPMIVVPGGFGIRLEDHFHVTDAGAAWFTPPSPAIDRPFP